MPHVFPCPAPRVRFSDAPSEVDGSEDKLAQSTDESKGDAEKQRKALSKPISEKEMAEMRRKAHECPVPKPPGIVGRILGFKEAANQDQSKSTTPSQQTKRHDGG